MSNETEKPATTINVAMIKEVHGKAKKLQEANKLATISDAIDLALDTHAANTKPKES